MLSACSVFRALDGLPPRDLEEASKRDVPLGQLEW
jgi:hypothetical protein